MSDSAEVAALSGGSRSPMGLRSLWLVVMSAAGAQGGRSRAVSGTWLWVCVTFLSALTSLVASGDFSHSDSRLRVQVSEGGARQLPFGFLSHLDPMLLGRPAALL